MTEEHFGGFWRRAIAYGIDQAILQVFCIILFTAGLLIRMVNQPDWHLMGADMSAKFPDLGVIGIYFIMVLSLDMIYFTWFHGSVGQTPGKILLGLRVVQTTGEPVTFGLAFLRWAGYVISRLAVYLGFVWIAFDRRKQGWHDKIAGTIVVPVKKGLDKESYII